MKAIPLILSLLILSGCNVDLIVPNKETHEDNNREGK